MDKSILEDLLNHYKNEYDNITDEKQQLSTIGNRTLTKKREYQIANDQYIRDLAQIERLKIAMVYLLACIVVLCLVFISILPKTFGHIIIGLLLVAFILHVVFVNNNFHKRYNLNYALFKFNPKLNNEAGSVLKCKYVPA
jgi:hypothetical protein